MNETDSAAMDVVRPGWFTAFMVDCRTRKPSPHTLKAYRQDFDAIALILAGNSPAAVALLPPAALTTSAMRGAFAIFAETHEAASIRRCWSSWNVLCTFLFTEEVIAANPMPAVGRPRLPKTLPKSFGMEAIAALLATFDDAGSNRKLDWPERDRAMVLTALLSGMRSDELIRANIGDIRVANDAAAMMHVRGKGNRDRYLPVEPALLATLGDYLLTRRVRFPPPPRAKYGRSPADLAAWPRKSPLFVGTDGERITRGALQYRVQRAYQRAGLESQREKGALVHALRHTYATALANENVSVYTLMKLLGHGSLATAQRYVAGAGTDTRPAAAQNPIYRMLGDSRPGDSGAGQPSTG